MKAKIGNTGHQIGRFRYHILSESMNRKNASLFKFF